MVMISPCSGCDTPFLANILALFETVSGGATIAKSAWWYFLFRIPASDDLEDSCSRQEDNESSTSIISEENANNVLWTLTGMTMGTLNICLGLFLLVGLYQVNYVFLVGWCLSFPVLYLIDCLLFTFLLKYCTSKERFDRCRTTYVSSSIFSFIFNSYVLWVGISVIWWCQCRSDPFHCDFSREYCHSLSLNFTLSDPWDDIPAGRHFVVSS